MQKDIIDSVIAKVQIKLDEQEKRMLVKYGEKEVQITNNIKK